MKHLDDGTLMLIVDTPGLFDTATPNTRSIVEIVKCVAITSPGPQIFIFVLNLTRFTQEELETIEFLKKTFGDKVMDFVIVVFTGKDGLDDDDDDDPMTIQDYVAKSPMFLRNLVNRQCKGRYIAICNKSNSYSHQSDVQSVMKLIRNTVRNNENRYYTEQMFQNAELVIREEIQERKGKTGLNEDAIREQIRKEIETKDERSPSTVFWEKLANVVLTGLKGVGSVIALPVTLPLFVGRAVYNKVKSTAGETDG